MFGDYFKSQIGYTMGLFNVLVQWHGIEQDSLCVCPLPNSAYELASKVE